MFTMVCHGTSHLTNSIECFGFVFLGNSGQVDIAMGIQGAPVPHYQDDLNSKGYQSSNAASWPSPPSYDEAIQATQLLKHNVSLKDLPKPSVKPSAPDF